MERDRFFVFVFDKVSRLWGLGWEVWLGFAPTRFDENIAAWAVADEAVVKRLCASGHLLFYYLVEVGGFVFIYGLADPTPIPGHAGPLPFLKEVDPSVCPVATAVKRGVEALASLYEAVVELEQVDPLQLSHIPIRLYPQLCQRPALERLCKKARALERLREGAYKAEEGRPPADAPSGEGSLQLTTAAGDAVGIVGRTENGAGGGIKVSASGGTTSSCSVEELLERCDVGGSALSSSAWLCAAMADRPALGEVAEVEGLLSSLCRAAPERFARVCAAYALLMAVSRGRGRVVKLRASLAEGFEEEAAYVVKRAVEALGSRVVSRHKARAVLAKILYEELLRAIGEG